MRESNFNFPAQNRACVCVSSALYDRRAIDAPSPSLPLVNSLTHLSYLTATSPRIREILSVDGGLERLVKILKGCAAGESTSLIEENLSQLKGKGTSLAKGARKSPFRPFVEYEQQRLNPSIPPSPSATSVSMKHLLYTYTLAFQCIVNIGVRGSEMIRTRVVEAGALDVVVHVLERYLERTNLRRANAERDSRIKDAGVEAVVSSATMSSTGRIVEVETLPPARVSTPDTIVSMDDGNDNSSSSGQEADGDECHNSMEKSSSTTSRKIRIESQEEETVEVEVDVEERDGDGDVTMDVGGDDRPTDRIRRPLRASHSHQSAPPPPPPTTSSPSTDGGLQFRDEDVLLSLQLLAYLSKYPHVRSVFHSPTTRPPQHPSASIVAMDDDDDLLPPPHPSSKPPPFSSKASASSASTSSPSSNVFSLVEAFTHRPPTSDKFTPRHSHEVQYWAGVIMRNACRKDESRGGIRQCANMQCGSWEKSAREFAKCRRCRKAKYCSKSCQSKAWQFGHRYWCAKATPKDSGGHGAEESAMMDDGENTVVPSSTTATSGSSSRRGGSSRSHGDGSSSSRSHHHHHGHHSHHHNSNNAETSSQPSVESNDDDDEDDLPIPIASGLSRTHHRLSVDAGVGGVGVAGGFPTMGEGGLNEDEVAQEMMGGGVFGERVGTRGD